MKPASLLRLLLFMFAGTYLSAAQAKAPPAVPYLITGTAISSTDGSPIPHCHLSATLVPRGSTAGRQFPAPIGSFDADEHGHFSIPLPSAGMWRLTASAHGYVTQAYDEHESFSSGIVLTAAVPAIDLRFKLSPEAVIMGDVLDEAGEPVRNAHVLLLALPPQGPDSVQPPVNTRGAASTDDRGSYEFDELPPGNYRINVQAQVWYAVAAQSRRFDSADQPPPDPSLDVTYPLTWYPGTSDPAAAETLSIRAEDSREADFQLLPVPSVHLRILPGAGTMEDGRRIQSYPMIERISGGAGEIVSFSAHTDSQGAIDVSGLAPGQYQVMMFGPGQAAKPALVDVGVGSVQTLDMSADSSAARISIHMDGIPEAEAGSVHVSLIDPETGRNAARSGRGAYVLSGALLHQRKQSDPDNVIEVPPGRYKVVLNGRPDLYLVGITGPLAETTGRFVTVHSGNSVITLHIAEGRAALSGIASIQGKPSVGAMVLLVPTTLGDPAGLNILRRDQTNTDGSFDLNDILPGQYILIAIDHGWEVNWRDPSTLRGYMMHGIPLDLTSAANRKQEIEAQSP